MVAEIVPESVGGLQRQPSGLPSPVTTSSTHAVGRTQFRVLATVALALTLSLAATAYYAKTQIDRRDAALEQAQQSIGELSAANLAFQEEIKDLGEERQNLLSTISAISAERDSLTTERDSLRGERDRLSARRAELEQRNAELEATIAETSRQLGQARQEGARQQSRAESAEALAVALAKVVEIDQQIQAEFGVFMQHYDAAYRAIVANDYYSFSTAYRRAMQSADRLQVLFDQRDTAMRAVLRQL